MRPTLADRIKMLSRMVFPGWGGLGGGGTGGWSQRARTWLPGSDYDYEREAGEAWRNAAVAACLRVLKVNFPQPKLEVHRKAVEGKDRVMPDHPLLALLNRPNDAYDAYSMWGAFVLSAIVDGNAYLYKVRSRAGVPVQLWWMPHFTMFPRWPSDGSVFISHYDYIVNGQKYEIAKDDVVHFRHGGIDPLNERLGLADLKAGLRAICSLNQADGYTASILRNMGVPGCVIAPANPNGKINKPDADELKSEWRERLTGERRGDPFVAAGPITVIPLSMTPEQMTLDKMPQRLEDQVCALTGVPAMLAGLSSAATTKTYANYAEARRSFYEDTLIPLQAAVACCLEHQLLGDPGIGNPDTETLAWSYRDIACLQEDQDKVWTRVGLAYFDKQVIKRSEARERLGLDWGPEDEVYYAQVAVESARSLVDATGPPEDDEPAPDGEEDPAKPEEDGGPAEKVARGEREDGTDPFRAKSPPRIADGGAEDNDEGGEDNTFDLPDGAPLRRALRRWYERQLVAVLGKIPADFDEIPLGPGYFNIAGWDREMGESMTPLMSVYWDEAGKALREQLGLDPDAWEVTDPNLKRTIEETTFAFCESTNRTTSDAIEDAHLKLREQLRQGVIEQGEALAKLTKRIKSIYTTLDDSHAELIAITETNRAVHLASLRSAKESGVVQGKRPLLSSNACPLCHKIVDEVNEKGSIGLDEDFAVVGSNPLYSHMKVPPFHPRCRCSYTTVLTPEYEALIPADSPYWQNAGKAVPPGIETQVNKRLKADPSIMAAAMGD